MSLLEKLEEQIKSGEFLLENARNDLQGCEGIQKFETKVFFHNRISSTYIYT